MKKTYEFKSVLCTEINDYLEFREKQGYKTDETRRVLYDLDSFLCEEDIRSTVIPYENIEKWIQKLSKRLCTNSQCAYISHYDGFRKYLISRGINIIPIESPINRTEYEAYVFSYEEIDTLLKTCDDNYCTFGTENWAKFSILLRIIYSTGLRISEALNLKKEDICLDKGYFIIKDSKSGSNRIVPYDKSFDTIIARYSETYDNSDYLFSARSGKPYSSRWAQLMFKDLLHISGINLNMPSSHSKKGFSVHCLRHTFAVHSFRQLIKEGKDMYDQMPLLSFYMGHKNVLGTEIYMHKADIIDSDIIKIMDEFNKELFPEV